MKMYKFVQQTLLFASLFLTFLISPARAASHQSLHDVYLANTEHELHVFRIYGKKPGKTIMVIGGIQGDEPGGYLTADLYADITLTQGNLIVVPRANFYSILLNQRNGLTGDMNRKFGEKDKDHKNLEQEIVSILKGLIGEADCLLNLHEGSGFYNPEYISEMENPQRFGQSVIFDADTYRNTAGDKTINLEEIALRVIQRVNPQIEEPRLQFKANNHNTISEKSTHLEQRDSASYYALTQANIPAFGIETSKSIKSNADKVNLQKLVVNSFMTEFGIIADSPGLHAEKTELDYVLVQINKGLPYAVPNGSEITVSPGDEVIITDIIANFDRGLAADFVDMGSYNDTKLPFHIAQSTKVLIRKDAETCGYVNIQVKDKTAGQGSDQILQATASVVEQKKEPVSDKGNPLETLRAEKLLVNINGQLMSIKEGEELIVPRDKALILKGVQSNNPLLDSAILANLKGFAPPKSTNDGNDINFAVYPEQDLWKRYSEDKKGLRYPVNAIYNDKNIGVFWIHLKNQ